MNYRGALLSSLLQVNVYVTHNLLNVLVQIANKMGLKKVNKKLRLMKGEIVPFLHLELYLKQLLLREDDVAICTFTGNLVQFDETAEFWKCNA
jgi:hypothetical protein